jgi:hypothetical protein
VNFTAKNTRAKIRTAIITDSILRNMLDPILKELRPLNNR